MIIYCNEWWLVDYYALTNLNNTKAQLIWIIVDYNKTS